MKVDIPLKYARKLEEMAASSGQTVDEVVQSLIEAGIGDSANGTKEVAADWKPRLLRFLDEMESLPQEGIDDRFSGENHDDVLYPREP